ncbi:hypothetical protein ACVIWV_006026 [Bradyrhizobium diazoefficiens]|uniref:hypothetical protein n=1 Tax=Bradyrhizobium TaxID=374 RepID=UPI000765EA0C|nr:hypothetical protein [Bradyrhizobium diazoefficiens]MBR0860921.1 hypothetical protein [Bradyrhizobium diazoefficiens]MBR0885544.1 hypothetical protein [Bradyrhizobium diazoefficiens]MBR0917437.1 hypothetical protein [Bradyrhizobium diazoefficiens]
MTTLHIEKLAWAVGLMDGAKRIIAADPSTATIQQIGLSLYLLIGFSIENALKSVIEENGQLSGKLKHSHNLKDLLVKVTECGLSLTPEIDEFIRDMSPYHVEFSFRYPEKAGWVTLYKPEPAVRMLEEFLTIVTRSKNLADIMGWTPNMDDFLRGPR